MRKNFSLMILMGMLVFSLTACNTAAAPTAALTSALPSTAEATVAATVTAEASAAPTESATAAPTATATVEPVELTAINTFSCRSGPSMDYYGKSYVYAGEVLTALGLDSSREWFYVQDPRLPEENCWVWDNLVLISGVSSSLPTIPLEQ